MSENERLNAALLAAKKNSAARTRKRKGFTSRTASKARKVFLDAHTFVPTSTMRIADDAKMLARSAWKNCNERVRECSQAIRERALQKIHGVELT